MPNRIIREGWLESEPINQLDAQGERFFLRLCLRADDFGRYHANTLLLKSALFPLSEAVRSTDIPRWIAACEKSGLVRCYSDADGKNYLEILKFNQRTRAEHSKFPQPPPYVRQMTVKCQTDDRHPRTYSESEANTETLSDSTPAPAKPPQKRNEQMDELATIAGIPLAEIGESVAKRLQRVLSQIKESTPNVTAAEIKARAINYRSHMPDATLTPEALAKHWGTCHTPGLGLSRSKGKSAPFA